MLYRSVVIFFCLFLSKYSAADIVTKVDEKNIVIALNDWSSQRVVSRAFGQYIEGLGYHPNYHTITTSEQWGALHKGLIHIQLETWDFKISKYVLMLERGMMDDLGKHAPEVRVDWWFPDYVKQQCPALPHWEALIACAELFSDSTSNGKGVFYTGVWDFQDADLIRALGLPFEIRRLPNSMALWEKLREAVRYKKAIVLLNWMPNWSDVRMSGDFVEFPAYEPDCEVNPAWGLNKSIAYDCANQNDAELRKTVWPGLKVMSPCVYNTVRNIRYTSEMLADAAAFLVVDKLSEEAAAKKWLDKYKQDMKNWTDSICYQ